MKKQEYLKLWLLFINIKAKSGYNFNDLIDMEDKAKGKFIGAWANVIIKATTINEALETASLGLQELNFEIEFIDKIENFMSLVEAETLNKQVLDEANWLNKSDFVFKISDKIFPYSKK